MTDVSILQECNKQKTAYGKSIEIDYATGDFLSVVQSCTMKQAGTGIPSFENIRTITGVSKTTANGADYPLPQEQFDGNYNHTTGLGSTAKGKVLLNGSQIPTSIILIGNTIAINYDALIGSKIIDDNKITACDKLSISAYNDSSDNEHIRNSNSANPNKVAIFIKKSRLTGWSDSWTDSQKVSAIKLFLSVNPVTVVYDLANSTTITGTPQTIPAKLHNTITNGGNGQMTVSYNAKYEATAKTSKAFGVNDTEELMRAYSADFTVAYNDPVSRHLQEDSMFELYGQLFDVFEINEETGNNNATTIKGSHVGYRLGKYFLPAGYAFVGTVQQVAQDILNVAVDSNGNKASSEFTVGTCVNKSGSFALNNTQPVAARDAVLAIKAMGAEVNFDNFTLNFPETCGSGHTLTIETGKNLVNIRRAYQKGNGNSYEIEFANTMRIDGSNPFVVGDNCIVIDRVRNRVIEKRIMTYTKCDDPTKDKITIGVFVKDMTDLTNSMQVDISAATNTANNSVHVGESYNNVKITHETGFESISADGQHREFNNGTDGDVIQQMYNGNWVTVWQAAPDGTTTSYTLDHTKKVVFGGALGYATYKSDGNGGWVLTGGQDADGNSMVTKLFNPQFPQTFAMIGTGINGSDGGFMVFDTSVSTTDCIFKVWYSAEGNVIISKPQTGNFRICDGDTNNTTLFSCGEGGPYLNNISGDLHVKGPDGWADAVLHVKNGVILGWG